MNIEKVTLSGRAVRLEPLTPEHAPGMATAIRDGRLWEVPYTFVPHPNDLPGFFSDAEAAFAKGIDLAFATIDAATDTVVGSTRFRCISAKDKRVEIGFTFIAESWQRSHINTEAKYLMLTHAFEHWGCHRVELMTDELNAKSRAAISRIGAKQEGILRRHTVMRDGRVRNTAVYSLIDAEWAEAKTGLVRKLAL